MTPVSISEDHWGEFRTECSRDWYSVTLETEPDGLGRENSKKEEAELVEGTVTATAKPSDLTDMPELVNMLWAEGIGPQYRPRTWVQLNKKWRAWRAEKRTKQR